MAFPRWRQFLAQSLHSQHRKPESRFFQVANAYITYDSRDETSPGQLAVNNRTMVFRGFADNNVLLAITDSRSDKYAKWQQNSNSQICWYFTATREQYRISANVVLVSSSIDTPENSQDYVSSRSRIWDDLSDNAKEQFFWSTPKIPISNLNEAAEKPTQFTPQRNSKDIGKYEEIPDNFVLVVFEPDYVDYLNLTTIPQTREINSYKQNEWHFESVNA